jgi:hypothetical protein
MAALAALVRGTKRTRSDQDSETIKSSSSQLGKRFRLKYDPGELRMRKGAAFEMRANQIKYVLLFHNRC